MKTLLIILALSFPFPVAAQVNIALLHQLVEDSKNEHEKQSEAKANQAKVILR